MVALVASRPPSVSVADRLGALPPNWFASVMGTGIVANAAVSLPFHSPALHSFAATVWLLATGWLIVLATTWLRQFATAPGTARRWLADPVVAHFYGAVPMALLTVGSGTLTFGQAYVDPRAAVGIDALLWTAGTILGLVTAIGIPARVIRQRRTSTADVFAGWLMPVVPPMVSATTGAALVLHLPPGAAQQTMLLGCYALFGFSLLASVPIIVLVCANLVRNGPGVPRLIPTLFIVLGPLGQSITAVNLLGNLAPHMLPAPYGSALSSFGLGYGVAVWALAMAWFGLAAAIVVGALGRGLPFSMTWWSFTFPIGTCVTGTSALALRTDVGSLATGALVLYVMLLGAWAIVATRTALGVARGTLFPR